MIYNKRGGVKMSTYEISAYYNYDDLYIDVVIMEVNMSEDSAHLLAQNLSFKTTLLSDKLLIEFSNGDITIIKDEEKDKYKFELCTQELNPAMSRENLKEMSENEILALLQDDEYTSNPEEYEEINWSLSDAFIELKEMYPDKENYILDYIAYSVEEK